MHEDGSDLSWTDEQWACLQNLVQESANRARVASSMLPVVGPLPSGQASVPLLALDEGGVPAAKWYGSVDRQGESRKRLEIDDSVTRPLTTIACEVFVRSQQAADPDLASVRQMLSRAAVIIGRLEDALVFEGQPGPGSPPTRNNAEFIQPPIYTVRGGERFEGLRTAAPEANRVPVDRPPAPPAERGTEQPAGTATDGRPDDGYGERLIDGVVEAIRRLESLGHYGPFGCVLGHDLYEAAHHPSHYLVMPRDRFVPFLGGGPLLRSSTLPADEGVIVASADAPIDVVIATDVHVSYLQRTMEPRYALRVSERLTLRVKQPGAIAHLAPKDRVPVLDRPGTGAAGGDRGAD